VPLLFRRDRGAGTRTLEYFGLMTQVVLVDVRPERRALMRKVLDLAVGDGTVVAEVSDASGARRAVSDYGADVAVVEIQLPVQDGLEMIATLRAEHPALKIVVCTFQPDATTRRRAVEAGADDYLVKPVSARQLRAAINARTLEPVNSTIV
jgi:DNA-binding NarL/FixJ family response regulator